MGEVSVREGSLRQRKRAATIEEIKSVAVGQLMTNRGQMTLRGVARAVGLTVQSLYHYFPSREDLITALVADAHNALADAVEAAGPLDATQPAPERIVQVALAYRRWAVQQRARFLLIYGTPVHGYQAPDSGPTTEAARRLGSTLTGVVFFGSSSRELARVGAGGGDPDLAAALADGAQRVVPGMPAEAFGLGLEVWARLHGLVMLEILGHLPWLGPTAEANYERAARRAVADLERIRTGG